MCPWIHVELCFVRLYRGHDNHHDSTSARSYNYDNNFRRSNDGPASATLTSDALWNLFA